jgi:hypothetical protein
VGRAADRGRHGYRLARIQANVELSNLKNN